MPPRAISRSSTNLPKTCGNIARRHLSATAAALALLACGSEQTGRTLELAAHYPELCPPDGSTSGSRTLELRALGDFDPSNATVAFIDEDARGQELALPHQTRAIELLTVGPRSYWSRVSLREDGPTDALLLPADEPCALWQSDRSGSGFDAGTALGIWGERWLLAAGAAADDEPRARALRVLDLSTAQMHPAGDLEMARARAHATVTELGEALLVAGGEDPTSGAVHDDAERIVVTSSDLDSSLLALARGRSRHAAISEGDSVLLVGGIDANGEALDRLERVAGASDAALARLQDARLEPQLLRLDDGRLLVAGGYTEQGGQRMAVASLEWLSADASEYLGSAELDAGALGRAFVATVGGGVLAVGGCDEAGDPSAAVWWVDGAQQASRLADLPPQALDCSPQLAVATLAAPLLASGGRLWRFDAWAGRFESGGFDTDDARATKLLTGTDAGVVYWAQPEADGLQLFALRHDTRNRYSSDVTPFLVSDSARLAPSAAADASDYARYEADLELLGSEAEVWVTDTLYADFDLQLQAGEPLPLLLLSDEVVGDGRCAWPASGRDETVHVQRRARELLLTGDAGSARCTLRHEGAVRVGLRGRDTVTHVTRLSISRGAP